MSIAPIKFIIATVFSLVGAVTTSTLYEKTEKSIAEEQEANIKDCVEKFFQNGSNMCDVSSSKSKDAVEDVISTLDSHTLSAYRVRSNIAEQWLDQVKHLPDSFFEKYSKNFMVKLPGVCHIKVLSVKVDNGEKQPLYIPFKKNTSPLTSKNLRGYIGSITNGTAGQSSIEGNGLYVSENDADLIAKLKNLTQFSAISQRAKEALFLFELYQTTMKRVEELFGQQDSSASNEKRLWEYDEGMCAGSMYDSAHKAAASTTTKVAA